MGYIYIIKNNVNTKVYIGQTTRNINSRFREHVLASRSGIANKSKLYSAMEDIGDEHFFVEQLAECDDSLLDRLEIHYISIYNSYIDGYNSTTGGVQYRNTNIEPEYIHDLIQDYECGMSYKDLAITYDISLNHVNKLLEISGKINKNRSVYAESVKTPKDLVMLSKEFEPLMYFSSIKKAVDWLQANTEYSASYFNAYTYIIAACKKGNIAYDRRWQSCSDLRCEEKIFRTVFEKEAYLQGSRAYQPEGKQYWVVDGILDKYITSISRCIDCRKIISKGSIRCLRCVANAQSLTRGSGKILSYCVDCGRPLYVNSASGLCRSCENVKAKGKSPKPTKEQLEKLLNSGLRVKDIAKLYGRNGSTVSTWKKQYGIK